MNIFLNIARAFSAKPRFLFGALFLAVVFFGSCGPHSSVRAAGASMYLFPPSETLSVGESFTVTLKIDSGESPINAADGALFFNPSEIQVASVSKTGSVFNLWTEDPGYSNSSGSITFSGGSTRGFNGKSGNLVKITFIAKSVSNAKVSFSSGSILAADGKGTNVLTSMQGATYEIIPRITVPSPSESPGVSEQLPGILGIPYAPLISSRTHPDPEKWYNNNDPEISWNLPADVSAIRTALDQSPSTAPYKILAGLAAETGFNDIGDGPWFWHMQFKNSRGWGAIVHRKILIDTAPPDQFAITVDNGGDLTDPSPVLRFGTVDAVSGIDRYEIKIGTGDFFRLAVDEMKDGFKIPLQSPGIHTVIIKAFDGAGNSTVETADVNVQPLNPPRINALPAVMNQGDTLVVSGTAYANSSVLIHLTKNGRETETFSANSDNKGNWISVYPRPLESGTYQIWAKTIDMRQAQSMESETVSFAAKPPAFIRVGTFAADHFGAFLMVCGFIMILYMIFSITFLAIVKTRQKVRDRADILSKDTYAAFQRLREEIGNQIEFLDGAPGFSDRERMIYEQLKRALEDTREFIDRQIKKLGDSLK